MTIHDETILCSTGVNDDPTHGAVIPPLYLSANYSFDGYGGKRAYDYTRSGNPTRDVLAEGLAALEGGAGAVVTSTGISAVDLVLSQLAPGARVIAPPECYGATGPLFAARAPNVE